MEVLLFKIALVLTFTIFFIPKKWKHLFILGLQVLTIYASSSLAIRVLSSHSTLALPFDLDTWSGPMLLVIDELSAFFILVINLICFVGLIYAGGYLKPYLSKKRSVFISLHLFSFLWLHASMILVTSFRDGIAFLLAWELMSLFSFILVIFDADKETVLKTGINYLLQMHLGFALIMLGFIVTGIQTGEMSFDALQLYFSKFNNLPLFLLFFAGFGIKAGFIPVHTWLPRAHPAAPSHVSGIMSGVMIKMGIYGIFRVITYLQTDLLQIGLMVLFFSLLSGILGVLMAIMQHDLKKLLAYHSIENIGIIGMGLAMGIIGKATGDSFLSILGFGGALLHTLNHALFKSMLFFAAGNIFHATHQINMDHLGGLAKGMRWTSMIFLIGALAISGLPPFNGFISEFFIYKGTLNHITTSDFTFSIIGISTILGLVLIGGLCVFCFTKAFGLTFLGSRRSVKTQEAKEVPPIMLLPMILLIVAILFIGFFPGKAGQLILDILQGTSLAVNNDQLPSIISDFSNIGFVNIILVLTLGGLFVLRAWQQKRVTIAHGPTWGCGYTAGDHRHQYTPTSYADSLQQLADPLLLFKKDFKKFEPLEIFPPPRTFHTTSKDLIEEKTILSWVHSIVTTLPKLGFAQTGRINHYLIYPLLFIIILGLLTYLNVI